MKLHHTILALCAITTLIINASDVQQIPETSAAAFLPELDLIAQSFDHPESSADTKKKKKKVFCSLLVKKCLTVGGNALIKGNLQVDGIIFANGMQITTNTGTTIIGTGNVTGPGGSTDNAVVLFSGTTGKVLKQSPAPVTIDPTNNVNAVNNLTLAGVLNLPNTTSTTVGVINFGGTRFINNFGTNNTFVGTNAGNLTTAGAAQVGIGANTLIANTGSLNVAIGVGTLTNNTGGSSNTAIGTDALLNSTLGSGNIAVGAVAGMNYTGGESNNIVIGNNGTVGDNNVIRIGALGTPMTCFIQGIFGATVLAGTGIPVFVDINGQLGTVVSSRRYKKNIKDMALASVALMKLRPVTFTYKSDPCDELQYGLIAEEVAKICPELVIYKDGKPETVKYHLLSAMLLNELQRVTAQCEQIVKRLAELEKKDSR